MQQFHVNTSQVSCAGGFFFADILVKFHISRPQKTDSRAIRYPGGKEVAKQYVLEGPFIIDFLTFLPAFFEVVFLSTNLRRQIVFCS